MTAKSANCPCRTRLSREGLGGRHVNNYDADTQQLADAGMVSTRRFREVIVRPKRSVARGARARRGERSRAHSAHA